MSKGEGSSNQQELQLAFLAPISGQDEIKDPVRQQYARTQAIKHSLQRKRHLLQSKNENFVDETQAVGRRQKKRSNVEETDVVEIPRPEAALARSVVDPFGAIAVETDRLTCLLQEDSARQVGEPVFSENSSFEYQSLRSVFNSGLEDPGLASAVSLALAIAANGGIMDRECMAYRLKAIQHVNETLSNPDLATSTITIGTVLLLVGVEARLGERETAQMHLDGTRQLLLLSNERKAILSHAVKRAIFWQDLFSSMIAGTNRVFSHETFPEIHWHRDPFQANLYTIPAGFERKRHILGLPFIHIVGDVCALQRLRESETSYPMDNLEVEKVDNQQAWIESRLEQLRHEASEPLLRCCIPAAYLCTYGFYTEIWRGNIIPSRVTSYLLTELQGCETWVGWDNHTDLLLWLLNIGVAFAVDVPVRLGFVGLWHGSHRSRLQTVSQSWQVVEQTVKDFIWSDVVYRPPCEAFWDRLQEL